MSFTKPHAIMKKKTKMEIANPPNAHLAKPSKLETPGEMSRVANEGAKNTGTIVKSSTMYYTSGKNSKEDKSLKVTVAISTKGKELLRSSKKSSSSGNAVKKGDKNEKRSKTFISYIESDMKVPSSPSTIVKLAKKTSADNAARKSKKTAEKTKKKKEEPTKREIKSKSPPRSYVFHPENVNQFGEELCRESALCAHVMQPRNCDDKRRRREIKSEPSLHSMQTYLRSTKPVSESKFRFFDKEMREEPRDSSYDHTLQFWDQLDKYDDGKSSKFWMGRSSSEPPLLSDNKENVGARISSPSNRKIRSCRSPLKTIESIHGVKKKIKSLPGQSKSTSSLNLSQLNDHADYQMYVMELMHSTRKSERFRDLRSFYSALERKGHLEKTAFNYDMRPRLKGEEVIDYERWKELRKKEKAEEELKGLYKRLKFDQKFKNFLYCPNDAEQVKWKKERDRSLRIKEKSVEDLRQIFHQHAEEENTNRKSRIDLGKDMYKPLWRGWSVHDVANSYRHVISSKRGRPVVEIKRSLSESTRPVSRHCDRQIGSRVWSSLSMEQLHALKSQLNEIYSTVSTLKRERVQKLLKGVNEHEIEIKKKQNPSNTLHVRSNSLIAKEQLYSPTLKKKVLHQYMKSDSISSLPGLKDGRVKEFSEVEKKTISKRLSHELMERVKQGNVCGKKRKSDLVIPRETLGAVAAIKSKRKSPSLYNRELNVSPRTCYSLDLSDEEELSKRDKNNFVLVLAPAGKSELLIGHPKTTSSDNESISSTASTVIHLGKNSDYPTYKRKYEQNESAKRKRTNNLYRSSSALDMKDLFGEHGDGYKETCSPISNPRLDLQCSYSSQSRMYQKNPTYYGSESSLYSRSRSVSPDPTKYYRAYLKLAKNGDVRRLKNKFESLEDLRSTTLRSSNQAWKRYRSDPELTRLLLAQRGTDTGRTVVKGHEYGDVKYLKDRYERKYGTRKYYSRSVSPIHKVPFRLEDRLMPHINVISKQANLLQLRSPSPGSRDFYNSGEVEKLKRKFERRNSMSLIGQMYTSSPDIRELRNISPYLECEWIAHQYPEPQPIRPVSVSPQRYPGSRPLSLSPFYRHSSSILKHKSYDAFADQRFDPSMHRPVNRYEPPLMEYNAGICHSKPSAVKFKGANFNFF